MMKWFEYNIIYTIIIMFCFTNMIYADETNIINLDNFIEISVSNNPEIFAELYNLLQAEALELQSSAIYDVLLGSEIYQSYAVSQNASSSNLGIVDQSSQSIGFNLSGLVPELGSQYKIGFNIGQSETSAYIPEIGDISIDGTNFTLDGFGYTLSNTTIYNPQFTLEFSQPLLKNWLGIIDKYPVRQAEINYEVTELTVDEAVETIIIELYELYFEWYLYYHQKNVFLQSVENSEELLEQIEQKMYYNLADQSDYLKVQIMQTEYQKARDLLDINFKILSEKIYHWMYGSLDIPDDILIIPEQDLILPNIPDDNISVDDTRQMKMLILGNELLNYQIEKEKNELLPELNLLFQYSYANIALDEYEVYNWDDFNDNYYIGLEFNYPLGEKLSVGNIEETQAEILEWESEIDSYIRLYNQGLNDLSMSIDLYDSVLEYDELLVGFCGSLVEEENVKYKQGRSDLYFIIENEDNLVQYQLTYLRDYVDAMLIKLQYLGLLDYLY